ncbi:ankyrin [Viridothelium virens]|uniref:Ankyrin n=1 Tax=Viridothelium virens TaxID=1048519 RepID=A0A6A6GT92_VIRVR|nr:ankyrin [Viridothelium virens]
MDGLSAAASIFTVLQVTIEVVEYLKDIKNAPQECQECQAEASSLRNLLNHLLFHLNQGTGNEAWYTSIRALTVENGPLDQYRLALEQLLSRVEIHDRLQKVKRRLMWKFTKEEVSSILRRMERLKSIMGIALGTDHFKLSQEIKNDTAAIPDLQDNTTAIRETQSAQQNQALLQWLSPTDFPAKQQDIISRRQDGTAQWFLDSAEFKSWVDGSDKTLFCPGIPGAGKTMMAAVGIDHLSQTTNPNDTGLAYLFCSYKASFEQNAQNLFAALLKQLVQPRSDLIRPLWDLQKKRRGGKASYDELQASTDVRILFTSRDFLSITEKFKKTLTLKMRASEEDVRRFVKGRLQRLPKCIQNDQELQNMIGNTITKAADGMFLLAQLHIESLYDKRNRSRVLSTLDKISRESGTLDEAYSKRYDEAIERIDSQSSDDQNLAKRALCWISYAQRLLTIDELSCALAIEPGDQSLNRDNVYDVEDITSVCARLVTIDVESGVIRLVHYTTQEYFERVRMTWNPEAQVDIATTCLTYLCFDTFQSGSCDSDAAWEQRLAENMFFVYSAQFWSEHMRPVQTTHLSEIALTFLCNGTLVDSAIQAASLPRHCCEDDSQSFPHLASGLHLTARNGLQTLTRLLITDEKLGLEVDVKDACNRTPLWWAADRGHEAIVRLLLETGKVDVDSRDIIGKTPLGQAAVQGHEAVVRLLVETGKVDVNSRDDIKCTPLCVAAFHGHEAVMRLLLETGEVDVNSTDELDITHTPLRQAAEYGYEAIVRLLLKTGRAKLFAERAEHAWRESPPSTAALRLLERCGVSGIYVFSIDSSSFRFIVNTGS